MTTKSRTSPRLLLATGACLLSIIVAACSGGSDKSSDTNGATSGTTADGGTVPHATLADGSPAPSPTLADGSPAPTLVGGAPAPTLPGGAPAPTLPGGAPAPTLPGGAPAPTLPGGAPAPTVAGGGPAPTVAGGGAAPTTVAGGGPVSSQLTIDNETYSPVSGAVAGKAIKIINNDSKAHTVTDSRGAFDINIPAGATASLTVTSAGTYQIHCKIHSQMKATITVA